jgi:hypothetical protein
VAAVELGHRAGEKGGAGALERGEAQAPASQPRDRRQLVLGVLDAGQDRVGVGDQRRARLGEPDTARVALEQRGARLALQRRHLLADGGLREGQRLGRRGEGTPPGDLAQDVEPAYVEH